MKTLLLVLSLLLLPVIAQAEIMYRCVDAQNQTTYTNKDLKGYTCTPLFLPPLSVVPDRSSTPSVPPVSSWVPPAQDYENQDPPLVAGPHQTYQINPTVGHNVASQVCDLYGKWLDLNLATRGGLYYNSLTAPLMTMFGGGYIPMECRR